MTAIEQGSFCVALRPSNAQLTGISLCSGVGGLDLGLELAIEGYRTVCYVERNSFCAAALVARMEDASLDPAPIWDDLKSFDGRPWRGKVDIVSAGYPCQPFTLSGSRLGNEDPRHLWPDVRRIIDEIQPTLAFFENVPGHLSLGFHDVVRDLQGMGFNVAARVVSAAEVGGSHLRERLFILAHTNLQKQREPRLHCRLTRGPGVSNGPKPDGQPNWAEECSRRLATPLGFACGSGVEGGEVSVFPPMPGDFAEWRKALGRHDDLKPGLQRLDDGVATWLDRSAAAGNGVVPLAAARAFVDLVGALQG